MRCVDLIFLCASAGLWASAGACSSAGDAGAPPAGKGARPAARVEVAKAQEGSLQSKVSFLGNVRSALSTPIAAALGGAVDRVPVRVGDSVEKGQILVGLDARRVRAELRAAAAQVDQTRALLKQARRQEERIAGSKAALSAPERERYALDVVTLQAQLAGQEAQAQRVRVDLSRHEIRAPFDGVVRARNVSPGAWLTAGQEVVELVSTEDLEVIVDLPYASGKQVRVGDTASLLHGGQRGAATVAGIVPALDPATRTMRLRLVPREPMVWLVAGLGIDVELDVVIDGQGVLVPRDAVVQGPSESKVVRVVGDEGVPTVVEVLGLGNEQALVQSSELKAGDTVMVRGNERYRPGTKVAPISSAPAPSKADEER